MRSARFFAADHGIKLPKRVPTPPPDDATADEEADETASKSDRGQKPKPDWFLHDDRDMDSGPAQQDSQGRDKQRGKVKDGWGDEADPEPKPSGRGGRGGRGGGKTSAPGRTLPLYPQSSQWHYIDPEGKEQGPFDAKKLINWVDLGYFGQSDLQVRKTGKDAWGSLSDALPQIKREAAGDFSNSHDRGQEPVRAAQVKNDDQPDRGRGRGKAQRGGSRAARGRREDVDDLLPVLPEGKRHPAEALLSPRDGEDVSQRQIARRGSDRVTPGPETAARAGRGRGRGPRSRPARTESDSKGGEQRAAQPGRVLEAPRVSRNADPGKVAWKLFTAERKGAEEPTWRYIDPDGNVQGPFNAREMHTWLESNYLQMDLPVCGMERKVSPPDLPPKSMYKTLGELMKTVQQGRRFQPVTVQDVASAQDTSKAQQRPSNGAESVEAKQDRASASAQQAAEKAARNEDAESVEAKEVSQADGSAGSDESDEEGEIRGRTAATDDEDSDYEPDEPVAAASAAAPQRAQPQQPAPVQQAVSSPASPERPISPQKAEGLSAPRQPASPEPVQEAAASSPQARSVTAPVQPPASPEAPVSPEKPETHAAKAKHNPVISQEPVSTKSSSASTASPDKAGPHTTGTAGTAGAAGEAGPAGPAAAESDATQSTPVDMIVEEPEEEQPVAAAQPPRQQASSTDGQQGMQIEDVSLQDSQPNSDRDSGAKETAGTGVMQSVMGAAKSFFGGHANEDVQGDNVRESGTSRAQSAGPVIEEPETTESETTVDSHHADQQGAFDIQEEPNDTTTVDEVGPAEASNADAKGIAAVQEGLQKVSITD